MNAPAYFETSDIKSKNIIETNPNIDVDIDVIKYTLKTDSEGRIRYGYSAQDVQSILSELVQIDNEGNLYLAYKDLHTLKIASLEKKVKKLESDRYDNEKRLLNLLLDEIDSESVTSLYDNLTYNEVITIIIKAILEIKGKLRDSIS
jgi:hypothetical protein